MIYYDDETPVFINVSDIRHMFQMPETDKTESYLFISFKNLQDSEHLELRGSAMHEFLAWLHRQDMKGDLK